jgi:hypothetical protein
MCFFDYRFLCLQRTVKALDVSASMSSILESALVGAPEYDHLDFLLIDNVVRGRVKRGHLREWIALEKLGQSCSLMARHETVTLVTDQDGAGSLASLNSAPTELVDAHPMVRLLRLVRRE